MNGFGLKFTFCFKVVYGFSNLKCCPWPSSTSCLATCTHSPKRIQVADLFWKVYLFYVNFYAIATSCIFVHVAVELYEVWSKGIRTDAVELAVPNLPWRQTNALRSRPVLRRSTYSTAASSSHTRFGDLWKLARSVKSDFSCIFKPFSFRSVLKSAEEGKVERCMSGDYRGWCTCGVWSLAKIAAQVRMSAPVRNHHELAHSRRPFSLTFTANSIMEMSYYKMAVYS
jgi:hypothetical protein